MTPDETARHLRALYRQHGEAGYARVAEEADRLGVSRDRLPHILKTAWIEGRELDGQTLDRTLQAWVDETGERVVE